MSGKYCLVVLVALMAICLAGCGCFQQKPAVAQNPPPPVAQVEPVPEPVPVQPPPPAPVAQAPAPAIPVPESVFFSFDKADITPRAAVALKNQAEWLKQNPDAKVSVSGYADERGTEEYNKKLGQERADAVKGYLAQQGVSSHRITTSSYGKDKPVCAEQAENCYSANRRADLDVTGNTTTG